MTEIWQMGATDIAQAVRQGALSATEVATAHLARIAAVNPAINAIVQPCEAEALATAAQIDAARAQGQDLGPMAGVPVTTASTNAATSWSWPLPPARLTVLPLPNSCTEPKFSITALRPPPSTCNCSLGWALPPRAL